ncbi:MAG: hypothetical protein H6Q43_3188, partial [Deltaproteobacteria bacterium]|nr:hypothetical protein [Deltaproteobacteria bacterium]
RETRIHIAPRYEPSEPIPLGE